MEDTMKVLDLLNELEDLMEESPNVPLTGKVMIVPEDVFAIVKDIRLALPEDIQQAQWIKEERERIISDAKSEYERIIREAKKQADILVDTSEITQRARKVGAEMLADADNNSRYLKMKTYDYVDKMLYDMQGKMDELNMKYFGEMYTNLEHTFQEISETLNANREEIKQLAYRTQNEGKED